MAALRDTNNDGRADYIEKFGNSSNEKRNWGYSTGCRIYNGYLYFSSELVVYRYKLNPKTLVPDGELEVVLTDDHLHGSHEHIGKPIAFDDKGFMYVPFGAPSNACQEPKRTPGAPGLDPCPQLEDHGGIWRFDANKLGQTQKDGLNMLPVSVAWLPWIGILQTENCMLYSMEGTICCGFGRISFRQGKVPCFLQRNS